MTKYFTILDVKDKHPQIEGVEVDVVGLRERITSTKDFKVRAISTSINMFFDKGFKEVIYLAPNTKFTKDPKSLYDVSDADATVFRMEKIMEKNPTVVRAVWDIGPPSYLYSNCIMVKSPKFAKEWLAMTGKVNFENYKGWEMDVLNMLVYYGDFKVRIRDVEEL